jgi:hypothetical protein
MNQKARYSPTMLYTVDTLSDDTGGRLVQPFAPLVYILDRPLHQTNLCNRQTYSSHISSLCYWAQRSTISMKSLYASSGCVRFFASEGGNWAGQQGKACKPYLSLSRRQVFLISFFLVLLVLSGIMDPRKL